MFAALVSLGNDNTEAGELMLRRVNFAIFVLVRDFSGEGSTLVQAGLGLDIDNIDFTDGNGFINSSSSAIGNNIMDALAAVLLNQPLLEIFESNTPFNELTRLIFVAYDVNGSLFQDGDTGTGSVILSVLQSPLQGSMDPPANLDEPVKFQFQTNEVHIYYIITCSLAPDVKNISTWFALFEALVICWGN